MSKRTYTLGYTNTMIYYIYSAMPLLMYSLPEIKYAKDEYEISRQRSHLVYVIRALQVIRRAVYRADGGQKLEFLYMEKYLDLIIQTLVFDVDANKDEFDKVYLLSLEILRQHLLDYPQTDHLILIHENLLPAIHKFYIRSILRKQFSTVEKIVKLIFDAAHSTYNPKIITYDSHCLFILYNTLNLKEPDYLGQEYEACESIKHSILTILKLAQIEELYLPLQHLYADYLIKVMENNIIDDYTTCDICQIMKIFTSAENCIFSTELDYLYHLVTLISDIDSDLIYYYCYEFRLIISSNVGEE